ncbi:DNA-binding LytR/AlgR family response regulator [Aquimarina sp. EL_43]|uniref:LytR/AlgR family response regulator transcription factor n=1 Tax=unclassified Aquimarina TaxID=2627091 RepID=UPI0018C8EC81|nr:MULTISPECIES: LytTR family DNA-binding domain-containing protein [unclassified Aquimarina]MBG6129605.1 DNA-binding LytR/AlgR family response regulator [Aquimarina sp. EL_35]MBG6150670.1 DNA-binding LytR/AlgR family response regulator [Aquimarina sp. EL_32]MBG6168023.1 DNA-binding LytR/AlgR family response regulator [Aquimarina sp. EL_43]
MNCITIDDEPLAHKVIKNYCTNLSFLNVVKECYSAFDAMNYLNDNQVDLIFLDINMPKLKGLDFLRTLSDPPLIIVTTAYQEYAIEGYELNILDYLLKPFSFERFLKAINKAQSQKKMMDSMQKGTQNQVLSNTKNINQNDSIFVKGDKKMHQIQLDSILYLESLGSYVKIHLENETITSLDRLTNFENTLPENQFLRIHRSYIIALKKIQTIEGNRLKITGIDIPIGNVYKHNLTNAIKK